MQQFDIVAVRFPFSDQSARYKLRPAIVVSNQIANRIDHDLLCCPITTRLRQEPFSFPLDNHFLTHPLPSESEVRCNKVTTIRRSLITKKVSRLYDASKQAALLDCVIRTLRS
jgi:mRNA-degrading endonuclease toxin of MazEF toxin-antitoxin module